ncbi:lipase member K-like [Tetranychus urticae]|uniref:lipase member K-like n=1 Tax=Tetranychus urticae TaxID=32264 RepID=UPI00077B967C|nr:lipase member K-like [Tetranychus urticae]
MAQFLVFIAFSIFTVNASYGLSIDEDSGSVASTNPTLAEEQAFIKLFGSKDPDEAATCGQLIESRGFEYEVHYVTTEDGYILQNFRIINRYTRESGKKLKPILLLHAFATSCSAWLVNSPGGHIKPWINGHPPNDTSAELGFLLANLGYDVWLINVRGTSYSTNHTHLDPEDPQFWDYSFYEIGIYDVTATVEYIKKETGFETIIVIGFSQGTIQLLIQMSAIPGYDKNYDLVILITPIGFLGDKSGLVGAIPIPLLRQLLSLRNGPFPPMSAITFGSFAVLCERPILTPICVNVLGGIFGFNTQQLNVSRTFVYTSQIDRSSNKNGLHILQFIESNHLRYFDYGEDKNYELYGSAEPPEFPFYKINPNKLVFISGLNDQVTTPINVQNLRNSLCDRVDTDHVITDPYFNHGDIVIAKDAFPLFNDIVVRSIEEKMLHDEL